MSETVERVAIRLFWKSEHLDPSAALDCVPENEWFGDGFPANMDERKREFWRLMAKEAILSMRMSFTPQTARERMFARGSGETVGEYFILTHAEVDESIFVDKWNKKFDEALA